MIFIDPPTWPGRGQLWSHLISDTSLEELHDFAVQLDLHSRSFDGDHYDVPATEYQRVVDAGAIPVGSREIVARLHAAGLRRRKRPRALP